MNDERGTKAQWDFIKKLRRRAGMGDGAKPPTMAKASQVIERLIEKTKDIEPGSRELPTDAQLWMLRDYLATHPMPRTKADASRIIEEIAERLLIEEYTGASP